MLEIITHVSVLVAAVACNQAEVVHSATAADATSPAVVPPPAERNNYSDRFAERQRLASRIESMKGMEMNLNKMAEEFEN